MSTPNPVSASPPSRRRPTSALGVTRVPARRVSRELSSPALMRVTDACVADIRPAGWVIHAVGRCADPQRVGFDRQPESAGSVADELAPGACSGHAHRQTDLQRQAPSRCQPQRAGLVPGRGPGRDALGRLVADPGIQPGHTGGDLATGSLLEYNPTPWLSAIASPVTMRPFASAPSPWFPVSPA